MTVTELTDTCHRFDWHPVAAGVEFSVPGKLIIISLLLDSYNFKLWRIAHSEICLHLHCNGLDIAVRNYEVGNRPRI